MSSVPDTRPANDDRTTRAVIRTLEPFALHGPGSVTVRRIAAP